MGRNLALIGINSTMFKLSILKVGKLLKQGEEVIFYETKWLVKLIKLETLKKLLLLFPLILLTTTFDELINTEGFKTFADKDRENTGGIPISSKISANHIEEDIQFAVDTSTDYINLDGRDGRTGAAPLIFRNNISVPTIPALTRSRYYFG